ncbi:hypothetical protein EV421DRAFT_354997 [Armillaria borealis]|uniref:Uncharacterized protein n=1 Tax=Armillaria borealis TaxID=47425 RepID=A0AA39MDA2_9AGAR|nr:hypothetical protein EV421DRAFT_354997 [Armillaria borealis]
MTGQLYVGSPFPGLYLRQDSGHFQKMGLFPCLQTAPLVFTCTVSLARGKPIGRLGAKGAHVRISRYENRFVNERAESTGRIDRWLIRSTWDAIDPSTKLGIRTDSIEVHDMAFPRTRHEVPTAAHVHGINTFTTPATARIPTKPTYRPPGNRPHVADTYTNILGGYVIMICDGMKVPFCLFFASRCAQEPPSLCYPTDMMEYKQRVETSTASGVTRTEQLSAFKRALTTERQGRLLAS